MYKPYVGGAEIQAERMSLAMAARGNQVTVLTRRCGRVPGKETVGGVQIVRLPFLPWGVLTPLTFMLLCLCYILLHRRQIDLIHAHQHDSAFTAATAGKLTGIPVIAHFHGGSHDLGSEVEMLSKGRKGKLMLPIVKGNTNAFIAVSNNIREDLIASGFTTNIHVIPNGIDHTNFSPVSTWEKFLLRQTLGLPENTVIFIFSGRLEPVKGIDLLLLAWEQLEMECFSGVLVILGSGSLHQAVEARGRVLKNCLVRGTVANVNDYLRASDIFVMPSRYEGTSLAVLEAMACQLPVLLTSVGGNVDLIKNQKDGVLIPPENLELLTTWMKLLHDQAELREHLGAESRRKVLQYFSFSKIMDEYENICLDLVRKKGLKGEKKRVSF
jgi:glycosyltransferase involved in cell wall biosynthesis